MQLINSEEKLLERLRGKFLRAYRAEVDARKEDSIDSEKFYDGEQWTAEDKSVLDERKQPVVTINRCKPKVDALVGMELKMPVDTKAYERKTHSFRKARHITAAFKFVEQTNCFDKEESIAFKRMCVRGKGWYKVWKELDDSFNVNIITKQVNGHNIFLDPCCEKVDLSDADDISETKWMDLDDAKSMWPQHKAALDLAVHATDTEPDGEGSGLSIEEKPDQYRQPGEQISQQDIREVFVDTKMKKVRIINLFYKEPYTARFIWGPGLKKIIEITDDSEAEIAKIKETVDDAIEHKEIRYKLHSAIFVWSAILEHKKNIKPWDKKGKFDYVLVACYDYQQPGKRGRYYGVLQQLLDPQREINRRRSKMLHLLNTNQLFFEKGAFKDTDKARREMSRPDGMIEFRKGYEWKPEKNTALAASQFQLLQESKAEIEGVGVRGELEGGGSSTSGRHFMMRHEAASQGVSELFSNLRDGRRRVFRLVLDLIQAFWTDEMQIHLGVEEEEFVLNQRGPGGEIRNYVRASDYDVIIDEAPEHMTLMSEEMDKLVKLAQLGIPVPPDMILEISSMPQEKKQRIVKSMQASQQASEQEQAAKNAKQTKGANQ